MKQFFIFFILFGAFLKIQAQLNRIPILEREITIHANDQSVASVLSDISGQAGFVFSYSPDAINTNTAATLDVEQKPVRLVLSQLFNDEVSYKVKGKYVILRKNTPSPKEKGNHTVEGYVYSRKGEKLTEASIYDKNLLVSAVTDRYGYFRMEIPEDEPLTSLHISKAGFADTLIIASPSNQKLPRTLEVALNSQDSTLGNKRRTAFQKFIPQWLIPKKIKIHSLNLNDSLFKNVQFSLIPQVSTNLFLTGNVENDFSFNLTAGYVYGVRKAEFGGILNIVRTDAGKFQGSGIGNIVGGTATGVQAAGIFNFARLSKGVQGAGIFNIAAEKSDIQLAGIFNQTKETNVQAAGIGNIATRSDCQLSGIFNIATENSDVQLAGIFNQAKETNVQVAGIWNIATRSDSQLSGAEEADEQVSGMLNRTGKSGTLQIAGCVNVSGDYTNVQIAGLINKAKFVKTLQLSVINIADTCAGIPLGFFSYVKKGYHKLELSYDEMSFTSLAFRTGVKHFYTILSAGIATDMFNKGVWTYGYGMGTSLGNPDKLLFDIDLSSHQLFSSNSSFENTLYKAYMGIDCKIFKKCSVAAGLSYNILVSDTQSGDYQEVFAQLAPYHFTDHTSKKGFNIKTWIGGKIAIRLF